MARLTEEEKLSERIAAGMLGRTPPCTCGTCEHLIYVLNPRLRGSKVEVYGRRVQTFFAIMPQSIEQGLRRKLDLTAAVSSQWIGRFAAFCEDDLLVGFTVEEPTRQTVYVTGLSYPDVKTLVGIDPVEMCPVNARIARETVHRKLRCLMSVFGDALGIESIFYEGQVVHVGDALVVSSPGGQA